MLLFSKKNKYWLFSFTRLNFQTNIIYMNHFCHSDYCSKNTYFVVKPILPESLMFFLVKRIYQYWMVDDINC